ncbi:MAG: TIGR03066 family protein [Planctomycetes bacterium]|nr:TIGR03066 family protein [Planctomycetota bacterium]
MNALRLLVTGMIVCVFPFIAQADDKKDKPDNTKLLVGKWEVTKAEKELPVGSVIEFSKDGKMKITAKNKSVDAVYTVEGDKIEFTLKLGDRDEKKDPLTIKKLSEQELVLSVEKGITFEFKRVK